MFELTPMEEHRIRSDGHCNNADALGVAPYVAAEIAITAGHSLSTADDTTLHAAFIQWANLTSK